MNIRKEIYSHDIDWIVYGSYIPGDPGHLGSSILPEDSVEPSPAEFEITGLYVRGALGGDLAELVLDEVKEDIVEEILNGTE